MQYTTPAFSGFTLAASHISHGDEVIGQDQLGRDITRDNGTSMSLAYDKNGIYLAYGIDRNVEAND
ncbi:hypothetical protein [Microbulbifer halophilus]|uniref:hypothetical protein n=1 Tax=Microbulbifer halophilus TaxID=453963 RepID=UPI00361818E3